MCMRRCSRRWRSKRPWWCAGAAARRRRRRPSVAFSLQPAASTHCPPCGLLAEHCASLGPELAPATLPRPIAGIHRAAGSSQPLAEQSASHAGLAAAALPPHTSRRDCQEDDGRQVSAQPLAPPLQSLGPARTACTHRLQAMDAAAAAAAIMACLGGRPCPPSMLTSLLVPPLAPSPARAWQKPWGFSGFTKTQTRNRQKQLRQEHDVMEALKNAAASEVASAPATAQPPPRAP